MVILGIGTYVYAFSRDFQCGSSCNVNVVIGLTKLAIQGTGTYVYAVRTDFQCGSSCDVNSVIGLTKFGNLENWYTCICIQCHSIWCRYGLDIKFQSDFDHDVLYIIWRLFFHII